ncbi:molybdopterin cofactor-binding domain-containing protein [Psychrobacter sp.]|uniref:xanthine dehydrogenase molybdopterin binding subunit n=1 Tax=Psychrobacter sp. TaxID=56811 RepID=UPI0025E89045|nr:molybdopterin cofactor-binding domain-containing protein [Psychrobacter sp.]
MSHHSPLFDSYEVRRQRPPKNKIGESTKHDSAINHVMGSAEYVDDIAKPINTLHLAIGKSDFAHAHIQHINLDAVWSSEGVVDVICFKDLPAQTDIGPVFKGDPLIADTKVVYVGQTIFVVAATSHRAAKKAIAKAVVDYQPLPALLTIDDALKQKQFVRPSYTMQRGKYHAALKNAPITLTGAIHMLGQEHFYLEGQVAYVIPSDDGGLEVYTSSQHPSEVQQLVAEVTGLPFHSVNTIVRRMGGAFGGKETQAAAWACMAGIMAKRHNVPVSMRLDRQDDMVVTGKRHEFSNRYKVGIDETGKIQGVDMQLAALCGYSPDLSDAIVDRAMFHCDNAYYYPTASIVGHRCRTHTVSNTAYRGFGGPQGLMTAEYMIDHIAYSLGKDPLEVRLNNLYQNGQQTHYGQPIEHFDLSELMEMLVKDSDYYKRRDEIIHINKQAAINGHPKRRGIALTPVKFGISFTVQTLNQAGALVHIYTDGSIHLNHGGTEMEQGLFVKVAQVIANEFAVDLDTVKVSATQTDKVPNTSPTAASSGTDLNGKASQDACRTIKNRLIKFACDFFKVEQSDICFKNNHVHITNIDSLDDNGTQDNLKFDDNRFDNKVKNVNHTNKCRKVFTFAEFVTLAYKNRVSLSATGFYKTPKIFYERDKAWGRPFLYYALGAACSEVEIDTITGVYQVLRCDILHDVGQSINPAIDIGQIEGGFVQGMGWLTQEELIWDENGKFASNSPANYKIPTAHDIPKHWNVKLYERKNKEQTVYNSKAVGEPPFMLAASVWCAINNAVASIADYSKNPELAMPATPEAVLKAVIHLEGGKWGLDDDDKDDLNPQLDPKNPYQLFTPYVEHETHYKPPKISLSDGIHIYNTEPDNQSNVAGSRGPAQSLEPNTKY